MRLLVLFTFIALASAHFQLQVPAPRGAFNEDNEPTFCDGYKTASNRTAFPLKGGSIKITSEHPKWNAGVIVSTVQNPQAFDNFKDASGNDQLAVPFFTSKGQGDFCFAISFPNNITGIQDGANVTIQIVFDGGDGKLYQCADLTLSSSTSPPAASGCKQAGPGTKSGAEHTWALSPTAGLLGLIGALMAFA